MRLIDADELVDILIVNRYYPFGVSIDEVPTVDAIPVTWIANWVTTHDEFSWSMMLHDWREEE